MMWCGMENPVPFEVEGHTFMYDGAKLVKAERTNSRLLLDGWFSVDDSNTNTHTLQKLGVKVQ